MVYKGFLLIHEPVVNLTFSAGTPKIHPRGIAHGMFDTIELARSANDVIKTFRGVAQLQDQLQWLFGEPAPSLFKQNATTLNGGESYGVPTNFVSTQNCAAREVIYIPCENILSSEFVRTCVNLRGINTGKLRVKIGAASQMMAPDDASTISAYGYSGTLSLYAITADHLGDLQFSDWKQSFDELIFGAQVNNTVVEFKPLGLLQGFHLRAYKGNKYVELNTQELKDFLIKITYNDNNLFEGDMAAFQSLNGAKSSMQKYLRSSAYLNCLNNSTFLSGLETGQDAKSVTPLRFTVSTPASINHSTDPVRLIAEYDIIKL